MIDQETKQIYAQSREIERLKKIIECKDSYISNMSIVDSEADSKICFVFKTVADYFKIDLSRFKSSKEATIKHTLVRGMFILLCSDIKGVRAQSISYYSCRNPATNSQIKKRVKGYIDRDHELKTDYKLLKNKIEQEWKKGRGRLMF